MERPSPLAEHGDSEVSVELSIVMSCLDEVRTVEPCIRKARAFLDETGIQRGIVVADNGRATAAQR